jgi:hypothetical protein
VQEPDRAPLLCITRRRVQRGSYYGECALRRGSWRVCSQ